VPVLSRPQQRKLGHQWSSFIFGVMVWENKSRAIFFFHGDDVVNKSSVTNKNLNPIFRRFLVFEKYFLCFISVTLFFLK
jgi:hypothetical protein